MGVELEPLQGLRNHTPQQAQQALLVLAFHGGNANAAARQLAEQGIKVDKNTLVAWRERYPNRYIDLCSRHAREIEDVAVQAQREVILLASETVRLAVTKAHEKLEAGKDHDPARTAQQLQTVVGIGTTKILELTGRPTTVVEHRSADEILNKLKAMKVIDITAEEE